MIGAEFKRQLDALSVTEVENFQTYVQHRLRRDKLSQEERTRLEKLSLNLSRHIKEIS
jgi:hypothetical protein